MSKRGNFVTFDRAATEAATGIEPGPGRLFINSKRMIEDKGLCCGEDVPPRPLRVDGPMALNHASNRDRLKSAAAVAGFHALLGYALIAGLGVDLAQVASDELKLFEIPADPPPPPIEEAAPAEATEPEGAAAPPNLEAEPTPIVAPPPEVQLPVPPPLAAAPLPGLGAASEAGASALPGPGTGAGGEGTGTGSGNSGTGTGGGALVRARWMSGELSERDYPPGARRARIGGRVGVGISVRPDGRVAKCAVIASSGNAELDQTTCRLVELRYRFEPARDRHGRLVADYVTENHNWVPRPRRGLFW